MALSDFTPERHEVKLNKGSFHVTGLSLDAVAKLLKTHLGEMETVFDMVTGSFKSVEEIDTAGLAHRLITESPGLAANIIACAAGEPEAAAQAAMLPFPVQVETLQAIGRLTFEEVGGVKKAMGTILQLVQSISNPA